jgi:23S rRNA pseudouridine2605 synthase
MIMTNDGELAERLMHPRFGFERVYHVRVEGSVSLELIGKMEKGVRLSDGIAYASGAILRGDEKSTWLEIRVHEGRNRVVRRIFDKLEHPVMKLRRTVYGPFKLGKLQPGNVRVLTRKEYEDARRKVMRASENEPQRTEKSHEKPHEAPQRSERSERVERRERSQRDERGSGDRRERRPIAGKGRKSPQRSKQGRRPFGQKRRRQG